MTDSNLLLAQGLLSIAATITILVTFCGSSAYACKTTFCCVTGVYLLPQQHLVCRGGGPEVSFLSTLLMISGTAVALNAVIASRNFSILIFSEPIIGAILGLVLLARGDRKELEPINEYQD